MIALLLYLSFAEPCDPGACRKLLAEFGYADQYVQFAYAASRDYWYRVSQGEKLHRDTPGYRDAVRVARWRFDCWNELDNVRLGWPNSVSNLRRLLGDEAFRARRMPTITPVP